MPSDERAMTAPEAHEWFDRKVRENTVGTLREVAKLQYELGEITHGLKRIMEIAADRIEELEADDD